MKIDKTTRENSTISSISRGSRDKKEQEYLFIKPLEKKYECPVCSNVLRFPVQFDGCGHRCCASCLSGLLRVAPRCPVCQKAIDRDRQVSIDKTTQAEIDKLELKCNNFRRGCLWQGHTNELKVHLTECQYHLIACPKNCGAQFVEHFLKRHLQEDCRNRETKCEFCEQLILQEDEYEHFHVCSRFALPCPNRCIEGEIPREEMDDHLIYECDKQEIPCPFFEYGCEFKSERKDMQGHISDDPILHLGMACDTIVRQRRELEIHTKELQMLQEEIQSLKTNVCNLEKLYGSQLVWKIQEWSKMVEEAKLGKKQTFFSPQFLTARHGYKMTMAVCPYGDGKARGKFMSVFICICRGEYDALLNWPFNLQVTFTLIDQSQNPEARHNVPFVIKPHACKDNKLFLGRPLGERNASFGAQRFVQLEKLNSFDYIRDDVIFIKCNMDSDDMILL